MNLGDTTKRKMKALTIILVCLFVGFLLGQIAFVFEIRLINFPHHVVEVFTNTRPSDKVIDDLNSEASKYNYSYFVTSADLGYRIIVTKRVSREKLDEIITVLKESSQ